MKRQLKYGIYIFLSLVGYYFIMRAFGLHENMWLRGLNFVIVFFWLYFMNHKIEKPTNYLRQFADNMIAASFGVLIFSISIFVYLSWINPDVMNVLEGRFIFGDTISPSLISGAVLIEGVASSVILSLIVMQIFKSKWATYNIIKSQ